MQKEPIDTELYELKVEELGVDSVDFILDNATYIRIQVLVKGDYKVIPHDLIDGIAKLVREYDVNKDIQKWIKQ